MEEIEYISRHGDVVRALREWRMRTIKAHERPVKNVYLDLGIESHGAIRELYEVKTACDRPSLYAAIGQLLVHDVSRDGACKRFLVLPYDETVPGDVADALARMKVELVRFALRGEEVRIV